MDGQAIAVDLSQWVIQASEKLMEVGLTREARCLKVAFERVRQPRWHCQHIAVHPWTLLAALPFQGVKYMLCQLYSLLWVVKLPTLHVFSCSSRQTALSHTLQHTQ